MGLVDDPHQDDQYRQDGNQAGQFAKSGYQVQVHLFANQDDRCNHRKDGEDLGVDIGIHDGPALEKEKIDAQGHRKNARNADPVNQDGEQVFPG